MSSLKNQEKFSSVMYLIVKTHLEEYMEKIILQNSIK